MTLQNVLARSAGTVVADRLRRTWRALNDEQVRKSMRSVTVMLSVNALGVLLALLAQMVIVRLAGAADFGRYMYAMAVINILAVIGKLGYDTATLRFLPQLAGEPRQLRAFLRCSLRETILTAVLCALAGAAAMALLTMLGGIEMQMWVVFALGLPIVVLHAVTFVTCARIQATGRPHLAASMQTVVRPALLVLLALASTLVIDMSGQVAMLVSVAAGAVVVCIAGLSSRRLLSKGGVPQAAAPAAAGTDERWRSVSLVMLLITGFDMLMNQLDLLMLGALHGAEAAGLYAPAARLAILLQFALNAGNAIIAPRISRLYAEGRLPELQSQVRTAALTVLLFSLPLLAALLLAGGFVLQLFGPEFSQSRPALEILLIGRASNALTGVAGYTLMMTNQHRAAAWILGGTLAIEIVLGAVLIPAWGMIGAAWTSTAAAIIWGCAMAAWSQRKLGINPTLFGRARAA